MLGYWWLPTKEDSPLAGVFASRNGNLSLKLLGRFDSIDLNAQYHKTSVILGAAEAKLVTLVECYQGGFGMKVPGTTEQTFIPRMAFVGAHLPSGINSEFESWNVQPRDLGPWLSQPAIIDKWVFGESNRIAEYSLTYQPGFNPTFFVKRLEAEVSYGYSISTRTSRFRSSGIDAAAYMGLKPSHPKPSDWFENNFQWLLDFHGCLFGRRTVVERIVGIPAEKNESNRSTVTIIQPHRTVPPLKELELWEILMPLPQIHNGLSDCFDRWVESIEKIREPVALLLSAEESIAPELRLLVICQALEAFHRNVHGGQYLSVEDYKPIQNVIVTAIPEGIDASLRTSLKKRIEFGYQYSLGKRLDLLFRNLDASIMKMLSIPRDFAQDVKDARNLFTHWDQSSSGGPPSGAELLTMVGKLHALARLVLLKFVGIDDVVAAKRMHENRHMYLPEYVSLR